MKYSDLYELLNEQSNKFMKLRREIVNNILKLRDTISDIIEAPSSNWKAPDSGMSGRYVEASTIEEGFPPLRYGNIENCPQENGHIVFAIKIGLSAGENMFPIHFFHHKIAIKYQDQKPHFSITNSDTGLPDKWETNHETVAINFIKMFADYLSFDPFDGNKNQKQMGFSLNEIS